MGVMIRPISLVIVIVILAIALFVHDVRKKQR